MNVLTLESVSKSYGMDPLLEAVTFSLEGDEKMGIIGPNGCGKTTLLRIIAGVEAPDGGRVMPARGKHLAYLPQNPTFEAGHTVLDAVFSGGGEAMRRLHDYEAATRALAEAGGTDECLLRRVTDLAHALDVSGGWELEARAEAVLGRLGLRDVGARVETLSGGQRKRVALARALILQPDLLLLDEPTNHLDADTIGWLEAYLARYTGALLLVTHDRYFLNRVTNRMLEIERGRVHRFEGNYTFYLEQKAEREAQRAAEDRKRAGLIRRELAWLRRGARARTTKQKARIDRAMDLMATPNAGSDPSLELSAAASRLGNRVVDLEEISKAYDGRTVIRDFSFNFTRDHRIGIIGPNGSGKTTLLDLIAGRIPPDAGRVTVGQTVVMGYYDQESRVLKDDLRVIDFVREVAENVTTADGAVITASQMLERFLFPPAAQYTFVGRLSGGERRRLHLLRLLMGAPNVLLLDEPTNDFDIPTLVALEAYLDTFAGCLVVVSHDRYFLDRTVDHLFRFEEDGRIRIYPGNYSAFLAVQEREEAGRAVAETPPAARPETPRRPPATPKLSYREERELEALEARIAEAEARKAEIEAQLATLAGDYETVTALSVEMQDLLTRLEADVDRWSELAERAMAAS